MDLDNAVLWLATRSHESFSNARELGLCEDVLLAAGKVAWRFILTYMAEHGEIPSPGIIFENSGQRVELVDDGVTITYVVDKLFDRAEFRSLKYGLGKSLEALEKGDQAESKLEVHKLSDHLRSQAVKKVRVHTLAETVHLVGEMYERTKSGEIGVPFPWQTMTDITMGMWPKTLTGFVARPGVGKCVHEDTEVTDPVTGVPRSIRDVYESDVSKVITWSKQGGITSIEITAKIDSGSKECLRVKTRTGREVIVTPEHPFLTPDGWRRADEVKPGMSMGIPAKMPFPEEPEPLPSHEVDLIAILLTEGSYTSRRMFFSTGDNELLCVAKRAAAEIGADVKKTKHGKYDYNFVRRGDGSNPVRGMIRRHGMDWKKATEKTIPEAIFRLQRHQLSQFISVFWMCDGYISRGVPEIVLSSMAMLRQLQSLLLRFGIQSRFSPKPTKYNGGIRDAWRLRVVSASAGAFLDAMSLWGKKLDDLVAGVESDNNPNVGFPRVSDEFVEEIKAISREGSGRWRGGLHEKVAEELGRVQFQTRDLFGRENSLKMTAFKGFCRVYGIDDEFRWLWDSELFWDEVVEVEEVGIQKVYDLTVRPTECFIANDIVVHNTFTLINIADYACFECGKRVMLVSPEMTRVELAERQVALRGKIGYGDLVAATLGKFAEPHLYETIKGLKETGENYFILDDEERLGASYIEEAVDAVKPDILGIDSIYMLRVAEGKIKGGPGSKGGRYDRILDTIDWMRSFNRRCNIPFVAISQLSREGEVKKGAKRGLKKGHGTGGLEKALAMTDTLFWDFHNLFAMYQDEDMKQDKQMLYVPLKARRQAKVSAVVTRWDMVEMNFEEIGTKVSSEGEGFSDNTYDDVVF